MFTRKRVIIALSAGLLLACVWAAMAFMDSTRFFEIDKCLDAGGMWDYRADTCIHRGDQGSR